MFMLKLNASYAKKVPAEAEYSSKSYHVALELELPDGLSESQLRERIHETFQLAKASVESEINANDQPDQRRFNNQRNTQNEAYASEKQIKLLFDLANRNGIRVTDLARERFNVAKYSQLTKPQCSKLINELVNMENKAA